MSILEYVSIDTTKKTDEKANHMGGFILTMGLKERVLNNFPILLYPGARASRPHIRKYCKDAGETPALPD